MDVSTLPVLAVTMGDPAGVGPEVLVRAWAEPDIRQTARLVAVGDPAALADAARRLGIDLTLRRVDALQVPARGNTLDVLAVSDLAAEDRVPGRPSEAGGLAAAQAIETGAALALSGEAAALVTGPISKEALQRAGRMFPGHTEMLAHLAGGVPVVMMLAGPTLRVVLVTIHTAYRNVPDLLTPERIVRTAWITNEALQRHFNLPRPRLAVAGLNPHAGENGLFGREEPEIIAPAVEELTRLGIAASGPFPPDTLFWRAARGEFDAVVCMYHDQGLIPFKLLHFHDGVNATLGLPYLRTSVDHGTGYDIAGTGQADHASMAAAIRMAARR